MSVLSTLKVFVFHHSSSFRLTGVRSGGGTSPETSLKHLSSCPTTRGGFPLHPSLVRLMVCTSSVAISPDRFLFVWPIACFFCSSVRAFRVFLAFPYSKVSSVFRFFRYVTLLTRMVPLPCYSVNASHWRCVPFRIFNFWPARYKSFPFFDNTYPLFRCQVPSFLLDFQLRFFLGRIL